MITMEQIKRAEEAMGEVRWQLEKIGRELYAMRHGKELDLDFESYERTRLYCRGSRNNPDWGKGTLVVVLHYARDFRGNVEEATITFPESWIGQDWRALERERLQKQRVQEAEEMRIEEERAKAEQESADRELYERLKERFEGD